MLACRLQRFGFTISTFSLSCPQNSRNAYCFLCDYRASAASKVCPGPLLQTPRCWEKASFTPNASKCEAAPWIHVLQLYSTAKPTPPKNKHAKKEREREREREIYKAKNRRPHPSTYPPCPTPQYPLGVEASTDGVEVQLADGNAHPPGPQVAQTQDTTTI